MNTPAGSSRPTVWMYTLASMAISTPSISETVRSSSPVSCCSSSIRDRTKPWLEGARADVVRAQTRVELTTTDFVRGEALFAIRGISQEDFDRRAQARKEAEAALIVARATERAAALNVEFTRVRAPIGGRISGIS